MILLVGASASGKTEIAKYLRQNYGVVKAITHTSRAPRQGEVNGVDYFFVSKEEFISLIKQDFFVEHTLYNGNYYGCSKGQVKEGRCIVVDPNGLTNFLALHNPRLVSFYLEAPEEVRKARMISRGDKPELIEKRLEFDRREFPESKRFPTDFHIKTGKRSIKEIGDDIHSRYVKELAKRPKL